MLISQRRAKQIGIAFEKLANDNIRKDIDFETELLNTSLELELLCKSTRQLLLITHTDTVPSLTSRLRDLHNYSIETQGNNIVIRLPALPLKKQGDSACSFIIDPLIWCIQEYQCDHECRRYEKARITICHCYPEDASPRKLRDCDNIEIKKLLDVLALYFLKDDNMACCEILHTSRPADEFKTEITISDWL